MQGIFGYTASLISADVDGAALTNSTTPTSLLQAGSKKLLGGNLLSKVGHQILVKASGKISTVVTTPGTLTLDLRIGSVVVANGGAMVLSTSAKTNVSWYLEWLLTLRSKGGGTAATFMHQGVFWSEAAGATSVAGEMKAIGLPQSAPAVGTGFDETAAAYLDLFGTWSVANASNSILCNQFLALAL